MAFNIVGELQLRVPSNLNQVASQIRSALSNVTATVNIKVNQGSIDKLSRLNFEVKQLTSNISTLTSSSTVFNTLARSVNNLGVAVTGINPSLSNLNKTTKQVSQGMTAAANATEEFGVTAGLAARRFAGFSVVAGTMLGVVNAIKTGVIEAFRFEKGMVRLKQVGD
jgi:hypothetical protein